MTLVTEQLYSTDAYLREISAKVTAISADGVVLNKTICYPGGGGQPTDKGVIVSAGTSYQIAGIRKDDSSLIHIIEGSIPVGRVVKLKIDWDYRYKLTKHHTALHVLSAIVYRKYQAKVTGGTIYEDRARLDFDLVEFNRELAQVIINEVNQELRKDHQVEVGFLPRDEADKRPELIRTKVNLLPKSITTIRTVQIGDVDLQADGGLHVNSTIEIGEIELLKTENKGKGRKRISIKVVN